MNRHALTLFELNSLVSDVIDTAFDHAYWVEAELSEAREVRGHCYMELIQKDIFSATPVARASAKCWKTTWTRLKPKFEHTTGQQLHAGMKVMLLVTANFHAAYGFSWIVQDIDPTYTLGDMARKRMEIIRQLKEEGVFDLQKELAMPMFTQRVAVISSENAAGYGDFCHQLHENDYGFVFQTQLFPAIMQGDQVEPTVISALNDIYNNVDDYDVVVIIRGGGATADLSGFDTLALAENVANFPLPIVTGIGHDRDESILDMVSHTRVKTPTAAAALLVDHLAGVWSHIESLLERITGHVQQRMEAEWARLDRVSERIPILFSLVKERQGAKLQRVMTDIANSIKEQLTREQHKVTMLTNTIRPLTEKRLTTEHNRLEQLTLRAKALDPERLLKRGYSITLLHGKALHDPSAVREGDVIETKVEKGMLTSIIHLGNSSHHK
ncbi:exodeoxyribonuclease 7 large subunit [Hallella multisaccharivorax DSM 17128]|uniref:Exodeoxyribonuclease 7 large subunit n=1 Tax=Hallella multisaccharivorax DSM 17128 TaxID=688246 RepID=F8N6F6_9BACT|nr:exodeoxyribonuclease VII large subunit [Hallella multisaccharivorax]EGN57261.1 Exodeoxyribonuclease VII large subunit [Hallella multisaccharivorax DSM 17128]GJG31501.1 exodeoxyribonuclease 7 large subunit [Hallella multisaccharivorax DSM 17128]